MSNENAKEPQLKFQLPDELANCETLLARLPLPPPQVARDELMYRAGWAAALVQSSDGSQRRQSPGRQLSVRTSLISCTASGVLGACLVLLLTWDQRPAAKPPGDVAGVPVREGENDVYQGRRRVAGSDLSASGEGAPRPETAAWLVMRSRALRGQWEQLETTVRRPDGSAVDGAAGRPKGAREMLRELLLTSSG